MTHGTLTRTVDTFIRIKKNTVFHGCVAVSVMKHLGEIPNRQEVMQMHLVIDRPTNVTEARWLEYCRTIGDYLEVVLSDDALPTRALINEHWCEVSHVEHLV